VCCVFFYSRKCVACAGARFVFGVLFAARRALSRLLSLFLFFRSRWFEIFLFLFSGFGVGGFVDSLPVFGDDALWRFHLTWDVQPGFDS